MMADFEQQTCISCFMNFGVPDGFTKRRRGDNKSFWCPGCGTSMSYRKGESDEDKLRRELDRSKQNEAYLESRIKSNQEWAEREQKSAIALRGQVTKLKKRAAAGICPCCNRSFAELAGHMASQHPEFRAEDVARENILSLVQAKAS